MQYIVHDLGSRSAGDIVEVILSGSAANVQLMDSSNYQSYKSGRQYRYTGGHATRSPVRLQVPSSGHWYVVVDLGGHAGDVRSSARVLPGRLPPIREASLQSVPSLVQPRTPDVPPGETVEEREFDVFISHASEDKA